LAFGLSAGGTVAGGVMLSTFAGDNQSEAYKIIPSALILVTGPSWGRVYTGDYYLAIGGTALPSG